MCRGAQTPAAGKRDVELHPKLDPCTQLHAEKIEERTHMPFTAQAMQVGHLLSNPFNVEAPTYQRSFAWTEQEAGKLLEDITASPSADASARSAIYFLGAMLFIERDRPRPKPWQRAPARVLEVVDGLQRLTTLTILFCVLRDLGLDDDEPPNARLLSAIASGQAANTRHRLSIGEPDESFFRRYVLEPGATRVEPEQTDLSPARQRILDVRNHFVTALTGYDADDRRELAELLLNRCCVAMMMASDIDQAHRMFEVLNARGKPLARNDILKADLLGSVPDAAKTAAKAIWDKAEVSVGADFEQLFSHIRAMYRLPDDKVISDIRRIAAETGGAQAFVERVLQPSAAIFETIRGASHTGVPQSAAISRYLRYLGWHSFSDWIPPAMLWWLQAGDDADGLLRFLRKLDRLAFGVRILGIGGSKRTRRFGAVVSAIRADAGRQDPEPLELTRQELRTILHNLRDLHQRNPPGAKHLLMRLAEHMAGESPPILVASEITVEHVLPRKLSAHSRWREWHPEPTERERSTESLGNLVLVTKAQNDRAGNLDLARKLDVYFNTPGVPIPLINEDLRGCTMWGPAEIKAREVKLMRLIEELWSFDLPKPGEPAAQARPGKSGRGRRRSKKPPEERDRGPSP